MKEDETDLEFEFRSIGDYWARLSADAVQRKGDPRLTTDTPIWAEGVMPTGVARWIYDSPAKTIRYGGCITVVITDEEIERYRHDVRVARELDEKVRRSAP